MPQHKPDLHSPSSHSTLDELPYDEQLLLPGSKLESDLLAALKRKQFELHLQPQVRLQDWSLLGAEVLLRWQHPDYGIIPPSFFMPVLEENGQLDETGQWVLQQACQLNRDWQARGLAPLRIAVNIWDTQLEQDDICDNISAALQATGLDPAHLTLELSEQSLLDGLDSNADIFDRLRQEGIKLALNFTGAGPAAAGKLDELPIDCIKLNKALVHHIANKQDQRDIMQTILSFAREQELEVIAEGVETAEQLAFLNAMQCTAAQGFLFSHPLVVEHFTDLYQNGPRFDHLVEKLGQRWPNK